MLFSEKYPDMKPIDKVCNGIMRGRTAKPCVVCDRPTEYIDIYYEDYVCSDECLEKMDDDYFKAVAKIDVVEENV